DPPPPRYHAAPPAGCRFRPGPTPAGVECRVCAGRSASRDHEHCTRRGGGGRGHDEGPAPQREPGLLVTRRPARTSLLVAALVAGLAKQLAVLLLGHTLAALLDD